MVRRDTSSNTLWYTSADKKRQSEFSFHMPTSKIHTLPKFNLDWLNVQRTGADLCKGKKKRFPDLLVSISVIFVNVFFPFYIYKVPNAWRFSSPLCYSSLMHFLGKWSKEPHKKVYGENYKTVRKTIPGDFRYPSSILLKACGKQKIKFLKTFLFA